MEILRDLRLGIYDVIVGINLLREGLDLPEVSLICILDADKEGYLRSAGALVQTMGRAARHPDGFVIMYADRITRSMETAISETGARRQIQMAHNDANGITPEGIAKNIKDISDRIREEINTEEGPFAYEDIPSDELQHIVRDLEAQMKKAASDLEFERAALIRDQITHLKMEDTRRTDIPRGLSKISN